MGDKLGQRAEKNLAKKRVQVRITLLGGSRSGKTSLINAFVNNAFSEQYMETKQPTLYYAVLSTLEEDAKPTDPKFNTLIEIEDTPGSDRMDPQELAQYFDPWWPRNEALAEKRPPRITPTQNAHKPFSAIDAPTGTHNDVGTRVIRCEEGDHAGKFFCDPKDQNKDKEAKCGPLEQFGDRVGKQCKSCRRFQESIHPTGQYAPFASSAWPSCSATTRRTKTRTSRPSSALMRTRIS